jgi:predicted amidophosphoribosyltransferase
MPQHKRSSMKPEINPPALVIYSLPEFNNDHVISSLGEYHKVWEVFREVRNPKFDEYSNKILRLKDNLPWAIDYFFNRLNSIIIGEGLVICYVPSSTKEKTDTGVRNLAIRLAKLKNRIDGTGCVIRHTTVPKNAFGADRSTSVHLRSIKIESKEIIEGATILLLDDVTTTGNSLNATKRLLLEAGAKKVYCFALAQTS